MIGLICGVIAVLLVVLILFLTGVIGEKQTAGSGEMTVGTDIAIGDVTAFYYTYATSTNPPDYQRYLFSVEDGKRLFTHEKREGNHWPLTEADITVSGTLELTDEAWAAFFDCLKGGKVTKREEDISSGGSGPWLYLYWDGDKDAYQQFSFASWDAVKEFEALCEELKGTQ